MTIIFIAIIVALVSFYIGRKTAPKPIETVKSEETPFWRTPMVIKHILGDIDKQRLVDEILQIDTTRLYQHFFNGATICFKESDYENMRSMADKILQWYNPEYNELIVFGYMQNNKVIMDWKWSKPIPIIEPEHSEKLTDF